MSDDMSAYKDVFLSESAEYVQSITDGLLALENDPNDLEPVETVFRGAHSLKGMAAAMGYEKTAELTHKMEGLMDTVRKREQAVDAELIDLMLQAADAVRDLIADESSGGGSFDAAPVVEALLARTARRSEKGGAHDTDTGGVPASGAASGGAAGDVMRVTVTLEEGCVLKAVRAYMALKRLGHMGEILETEPDARAIEDERFDRLFVVIFHTREPAEAVSRALLAISEIENVEVTMESRSRYDTSVESTGGTRAHAAVPKLAEAQTVRVSIGHLDSMVNLVGELVIVRARLERIARQIQDPELAEALDALQQISSDLQHEVMQTRMVPVGNIFNRFPRMVRDLARDLGRQVEFQMSGLDIELDRTVLDEIGDPIVHLLRNAIDHGVEPPAERTAAGKPEKGTIRLAAERDREQVRIIVSDDGHGMDPDKIWSKAVERGLVREDERDSYTLADILMLTC
ncbi:MAG: chemotaxis protein CheA, partial [Coriobacteriales bacterium]